MGEVSTSDDRPRRLRALFDRIGALDGDGLAAIEQFMPLLEVAPRGTAWTVTPAFPVTGRLVNHVEPAGGERAL